METNIQEDEIAELDDNNGVETSMNSKLGSVNNNVSVRNWCIYKVPEFILKGHEYFYQPRMISIGPVFYKDTNLATMQQMQEVKWIYLNCFLRHPQNGCSSVNPYINFVRQNEVQIRGCYQQESSRLSSNEFVEMIVLDSAFLIYYIMSKTTPLFNKPLFGNYLATELSYSTVDLFRLENQIPYFVLRGIFYIGFGQIYPPITFIIATLTFIGRRDHLPGQMAIESIIDGNKITDESNIAHLLHLRWICCCLSLNTPLFNQPTRNNPTAEPDSDINCRYGCVGVSLICPSSLFKRRRLHHLVTDSDDTCHLAYTAKQLIDAGVTFVAGESDNPLDVTFANGKLTISIFKIYDSTEIFLRNLIYFEQCHYYGEYCYFICYLKFLDQLIDTVEDVQVLVKYKILKIYTGSDADVVNLLNNIGNHVTLTGGQSYYFDVSDALNRYASTRRNKWMAILRSKYFNQPWTILSVIAAFILFVLTLLQTIAAYIYK